MNTTLTSAACAFILSAFSTVTNAALIDRGGGLIYDGDLNITWLADANFSSAHGITNGTMTWVQANTWAANLNYYDSVRNVYYDDWRLPTITPTCGLGYPCIDGEMGHLFYTELGGTGGSTILSSNDADLALFSNIMSGWYWYDREYSDSNLAWVFNFGNGSQSAGYKSPSLSYAWFVRPGDVAAVPVPAAAWLLGSGLLSLLGISRCKS